MRRLNSKSVYILSTLLLSDSPLSITEIAKQTGYFRQTLDPYITCFVVAGYITNVGKSSRNKWVVPDKCKQRVLDIIINNDVAPSRRIITALERKYGRKWVHLIDADSFGDFPNLALMKISSFHKARGDRVTFSKGKEVGFPDRNAPNKIYVSIIFKWNSDMFSDLVERYPETEVDIGGSGIDLAKTLPPEIEMMKPDYSLYPRFHASIGFSSRGCIRNCYFCIVRQKEGKFRQTQHPSEWYNPQYKNIRFLDGNILCDKDWFFEVTNWCFEKKLKIWFTQGLDIRLLDLQVAKQLFKFKAHHMLSFAWDDLNYEKAVHKGITILREAGFTDTMLQAYVQFYVYVNSDADYDSGVYRCRELKKLGCNAYVMFNVDNEQTKRIKDLKWWSKGKAAYWHMDLADFNSRARSKSGAKSMKEL